MFKNPKERRQYDRAWNARNRERKRAINKRWKVGMREWFRSLRTQCSRCPEGDPACLDWHHRERTSKLIDPAFVIRDGWGKQRILEELAKCELLCANCHRKEEARRRAIDVNGSIAALHAV